jgi:hypothetical protein
MASRVLGHRERQRKFVVRRQPERAAVRQHAGARGQRDAAELQLLGVDRQFREAECVGAQRRAARIDLRAHVAVVLLEVLRLQQHPF